MYKSHLRLIIDKKYFGNQSIKKKILKNLQKIFFFILSCFEKFGFEEKSLSFD